jgi:5'(3')-deoxyribonucleotidase
MNIIVDLDETIVNLLDPWLFLYNQQYNDFLTVNQLQTYNIHQYVKPECGKKIYDLLSTPGLFLHAAPFPGAISTLQHLTTLGHNIIIVTMVDDSIDGSKNIERDKRSWCKEYLWFLPDKNIIVTEDKYTIDGDVFIDDSPEQVINYRKHHPNALIIGIDYPYNKDIKEYDVKLPRDHTTWTRILNILTAINDTTINKMTTEPTNISSDDPEDEK